jgi:hypothetical protein
MLVYFEKSYIAPAVCQMRLCSGSSECLNNLAAILMLGDACDILLMLTIYANIIGASINRTPKPHIAMNGSQEIFVAHCSAIRAFAVALNTGAPQAQKNGRLYTLGALFVEF